MSDICRSYAPVPMPQRLHLCCAYVTPAAERTAAQVALLDAEIERTGMTTKLAERIAKTWRKRGFNPWSAMDIAELEMLKRKYGGLDAASVAVLGE